MRKLIFCNTIGTILLFLSTSINAQSIFPGKIIRPCTNVTNKSYLDPNTTYNFPDNASKFSTGFGSDDVANSELPYKPVPPFNLEPYGDLRRGPSHLYSDFVPAADGSSYYMYFDGTRLFFRFRMGSIIPGNKGYSVLLDTDGKFGASGPNADPNYQPATTGINGNPGFEIEVDLFTQPSGSLGVAVYNVDGTSSPGTPSYSANSWQDFSQIAVASTNDNGDPDFFMDFFIPFSALQTLGVTTSTQIRMIPTTVMAGKPAIGGPKSDIYGLNDAKYSDANAEYEAFINTQPATTVTSWTGTATTSPIATLCTAAPTISTVTVGASNTGLVKGTWTKGNLDAASSTATITIYKTVGGVKTVLGTTSATSANPAGWTLSGVTVNSGDIITAQAKGTNANEGTCQTSNAVTATNCNSTNIPPTPVLSCTSGTKGTGGTNFTAGWTIHLQNMTSGTPEETASASGTTGLFSITGATWTYSNGCSGGKAMATGSYKIWYTNAAGCASDPAYFCASGNGGSTIVAGTAPTITSPSGPTFTTATNGISGTGKAGGVVSLYVNRILVASTTTDATTGAFAFPNSTYTNSLRFSTNDILYLTNELNNGNASSIGTSVCEASSAKYTVICYTSAPVITTGSTGQLTIGKPIMGTSSEAAGTTIKVYNAANTLLATTTVQADGTWSTTNTGTAYSNGFTGNAIANTTYYATATGACVSANSATAATGLAAPSAARCGTITTTVPASSPINITSATTSLSGALSSGVTTTNVNIYEDGYLIGTASTTGTTWGPVDVSNKLYASTNSSNGIITIGIQETGTNGTTEETTCPTTYTVNANCTPPTGYTVTPTGGQTVNAGQTITFGIGTPTIGVFYAVSDQTTGQQLATGIWATSTSNFNITTQPVTASTTAIIKATSITSSGEFCTSTTSRAVTVNQQSLPVRLVDFKASPANNTNIVSWKTANEIAFHHFDIERSSNGIGFIKIGEQPASGNSTASYIFTDSKPLTGPNYYRLKLVDNDQSFTYSKVIMVHRDMGVVMNTIHPNPFTNEIAISISLLREQPIQLLLIDGEGRKVRTTSLRGVKGLNNIKFSNLENLPEGIYIVKAQTAEGTVQQKLIKISK